MRITGVALAALCSALAIGPALAEDPMLSSVSIVDEVRFGFHYHDVYTGFIPSSTTGWRFDQLEDLSFEVLFASPQIDIFKWIGSPRPNVGATVNLQGQDSMAHLGLTWQLRPISSIPVFLEATFGAALNTGYINNAPPGFRNLGCNLQFYEQFGLGVDVTDNMRAILTYEHTSNAGLCSANDGLSNLGLRVGWQF